MVDRRKHEPTPLTVFVDADAFVALAREDDTNHTLALAVLARFTTQPTTLITSNYVFAECVTVISQRIDHAAALAFINTIKTPQSVFTMHRITEELEDAALRLFSEQTSKNVSFVDCTNMAIVTQRRIDYIFSFDQVYRKNGYRLVEELLEQ